MSLLMDALKKAEQAKQQARNAEAAAVPPPLTSAQPAEAQAPGETPPPLPELPPKLELLDEEFIAHAKERPQGASHGRQRPAAPAAAAKPAAAPAATVPTEAAQAAARNVFAAKQPAARNRTFAIVVGGLTALAVAGIGVYFWLQLQPAGSLTALAPAPAPRPAAVEPPPAPIAAAPAAPQTTDEEPEPPKEQTSPARPAAAVAAAAAEAPIRITTSRLRVNPTLTQAFDAFGAGDLAAAKAAYGRVLKAEPRNLDALHGAAAVALREGRPDLAETYYLSALEADPKDAVAHAGLIGLRAPGDPVAGESRLKTLLAAQPDLPELNFALGNLYAREGRWQEAQQAYFKAYSVEPENPDYLFNLAVSLDQLRQGRLAVQYYTHALAAAASRPAGFDSAQVTARLRELQQQP